HWGVALVLGPNINAPMESVAVPKAYEALQKAMELAPNASEKEQAYINALAKRYSKEPLENRKPLDLAYANSMREVAKRFPDDLDAATLFGESLMDLIPWAYWSKTGEASPETPEILETFESVLKRNPDHIGAIHLYIHATEASMHPEKAEPYAENLGSLVPGAGHLVHMPAHTFMRVGRYHDASVSNKKADEADDAYVTQCKVQGLYPLAYHPHNNHFLSASAAMEGWSAEAIRAARKTASQVDQGMMCTPGWGTLHHYLATPLYVLTRFGKWDEILAEPRPQEKYIYPVGVWHYARGMAFLRRNKIDSARSELKALEEIAADSALNAITIWDINTSVALMTIAKELLAGELAATRKDFPSAIRHLKKAVAEENELNYDEPPPWNLPVRHALGAVLLEAQRPKEAEEVYREDLKRYPHNGWGLLGLEQSLRAQGKTEAADDVKRQFDNVWTHADVKLTASRF
ncbi:MAG: hypothetical protein HY708_02325, partial [Ignavibacteriae bacterium]|nr:hypothetical protein [Ignavibacteriota bacterium]